MTAPVDIVDVARERDIANAGHVFEACDRCGHRAYVVVTKTGIRGGRLTYCGHHGTRYLPKLEATGWYVIDGRGRIPR